MVFVKGVKLHFYTQLHNRDAIKNSFHLFGCENFTICSVNKLPVNLAKDLLMVKTVGPRLMMSLICCVVGSAVSAHPFLTPVSDSHDSHGYRADNPAPTLLFAVPQSDETPKLWSEMSAKERAEIWPFLTPRMQRYYWRSMTEPERRSMRAEFPPSINEKFRKRYVSPDNCAVPEHAKQARYRMSPEERQRLREQIREMHVEYYRFHHPHAARSLGQTDDLNTGAEALQKGE